MRLFAWVGGFLEASTRTPMRIALTFLLMSFAVLLEHAEISRFGFVLLFGYGLALGRSDRRGR